MQNMRGQMQGARAGPNNPQNPPNPQKRARYFVALFDYDPATMSPNPDACDEELPFSEGDTIKVFGDKDADGFYWGECKGRKGYVPHNMVMEVEGNQNRDRWGDIYANMPVKRMVALYDYDPQELSPNVDAEVSCLEMLNFLRIFSNVSSTETFVPTAGGIELHNRSNHQRLW